MGTNERDSVPSDSAFLSQDPVEDTLVDRGVADPLDEGFSSPERWSAGERFGTTAAETRRGESLDQRLAQEVPEADLFWDEGRDDDDREVGSARCGRLVGSAGDLGSWTSDAGLDGGAASAEEAAMHIIENPATADWW